MAAEDHGRDRVEKLMTLTPVEFAASASRLFGSEVPPGVAVDEPLEAGRVSIVCLVQPGVRLGGLLELPRAKVTIAFEQVPTSARTAFLKRFDLAFQRGGG